MNDQIAVLLLTSLFLTCSGDHGEEPDHIKLTVGESLTDQHASCMKYTYYSVEVVDPCKDLRVKITQKSGEPNVYVGKSPNRYPHYLTLTWSSYNWGSEDLVISSWDPEFTVGTYYIGVHSFCSEEVHSGDNDARYDILVESVETTHPHSEIGLDGEISSNLDRNGYHYYRFCVPDTCTNIEVRLENCLDPNECPTSYAYPELLVSRSIVRPTVNDHAWKLADISQRSVYLNHEDPEYFSGHHFVGVYGWCTPDEECPDKSTCGPCEYADGHEYRVSVVTTPVTGDCVSRKSLEVCEGSGAISIDWTRSPFVYSLTFLSILKYFCL
ncbi:uncharacterized protein [Apostichopus japonicus]